MSPQEGRVNASCSRPTFERRIKDGDYIVEFLQPGCTPCAKYKQKAGRLSPVLRQAGAKRVRVMLGTNACEDLADRYRIKETPSLVRFRNGKPVGRPIIVDDVNDGLQRTRRALESRLMKAGAARGRKKKR